MYSICYVLADDEKRFYINQLLISIKSLRKHMPDIKVSILVDEDTKNICDHSEAFVQLEHTEVIAVKTPSGLSKKEIGYYLKTVTYEYMNNDYLFIDTDTLIYRKFPDTISDCSIALVYDFNIKRRIDYENLVKQNKKYGYDVTNYDTYYNTGVMWVKKDRIAKRIFSEWNKEWLKNQAKGLIFDQQAFNYIINNNPEGIGTLQNIWNCQIAAIPSPVLELHDALILHYFNVMKSPFMLSHEEYKYASSDSELVRDIIEDPKKGFLPFSIETYGRNQESFQRTALYRGFFWLYNKHKKIYNVFDRILYPVVLLGRRYTRKTEK